MTKRIEKLRQRMVTTPEICIERALYMTRSYRETESLPAPLRRAKAMEKILDSMSIRIDEGELLAGWPTSKVRAGALLVEVNSKWILREMDTVADREWEKYKPLTGEEKRLLREEIMPYWEGKTLSEKWAAMVPPEAARLENIIQTGGYSRNGHHMAHAAPDYKHVLTVGITGILADIEEKIAGLDLTKPEDVERYQFYTAAKISQNAVLTFARRNADLAEKLAGQERDEKRREELKRMAAVCRKVPAQPAQTLWEALQSIWFVFLACMIEVLGGRNVPWPG